MTVQTSNGGSSKKKKSVSSAERARIRAARKTIAPEALTPVKGIAGGGTLRQRVSASAATLPTSGRYGNQRKALKMEAKKYYSTKRKPSVSKSIAKSSRVVNKASKKT